MKSKKILLDVENLTVILGGEQVIQNLSIMVERGEFLAILGPNGSGKSTLLRTLVGALPYEGSISWSGDPRVSYLPERLSPQKFREYPLSIAEFFAFKQADEREAVQALLSVGLASPKKILHRNPGELSSGQFQRMLIAWSIVNKPEVLLFDEPTTGIDIGGEETIYPLLQKLWKEQSLTIIMVTHELDVVFAFATHVLCIQKKQLCYGTPREALTPQALRELYGTEVKFYKHLEEHYQHHEHST